MAIPVRFDPAEARFGAVPPGRSHSVDVTVATAPSSVEVTADITNDTSGAGFGVTAVIAFDVVRSSNGRIMDMTEVGRSDGIQPLAVARGQMVTIEVQFTAPDPPTASGYTAMLEVFGQAGNASFTWQPIHVPLRATVGQVQTRLLQSSIQIGQGESGLVPIRVSSLAGPSTTVTYVLANTPDAQGISLAPLSADCASTQTRH